LTLQQSSIINLVERINFNVVPIALKNFLLSTIKEYSCSKNLLLRIGGKDAGKDLSNIE